MKPEITRNSVLDMQVCVPATWDDALVTQFANAMNPSGVTPWTIRRQGSQYLCGDDERVPCNEKKNFVHIMLDC